MFRSLQSRVTASLVALTAATVIALGIGLSTLFGQVLANQYESAYRSNAGAMQAILNDSLQGIYYAGAIDEGRLRQVVNQLRDQFKFRIGVYLSGYNSAVADSGAPHAAPGSHAAVDAFPTLSFPLTYDGTLPLGQILVSDPLTDRAYVQQQFVEHVFWIGVAACLFAVFLGSILAERLTSPVRVLTRAVSRLQEGHLGERVPEGRRDEAGELARQFNRMAERLEASFDTISADRDRLREFVGDVSHELRTPLTALRTFNELLRDGASEDAATRADFLAESGRQIERLDWLAHNLLDLSRLDAGLTTLHLREADLSETLRRAVEANRPAAAARNIAIAVDAAPLIVSHDPPRLEQAISNVVGNAVKFSPSDGTVRARLVAGQDGATVEVSDEGPGIPEDEAAHIFERFYRGRDANRAGEGSGLGLAIAKAVLDAHGGTISASGTPGRGTTMRLTLPLAVAADVAQIPKAAHRP